MKKFIAIFAVASLGISMGASATVIESGKEITPDATGCIVLAESVRLNLSNGVHGAYNCDDNRNAVNVGACHIGGSRSTSLKCAAIGKDDDGENIWNDEQCEGDADGLVTLESPGYRGFRASTTGGSVGAQQLNGACTSATADAQLVDFL